MSEEPSAPFDPRRYLTRIDGRNYLEVKWRLVWFRSENPAGVIETTLVNHTGDCAVFRAYAARSTDPSSGSATGYGSEQASDFRDYIEKAETKALGRALGALGYGTQFSADFADADDGRLADSPVGGSGRPGRPRTERPGGAALTPPTDKQLAHLLLLATRDAGWTPAQYDQFCLDNCGGVASTLSRADVSALIDRFHGYRATGQYPTAPTPAAEPAPGASGPAPAGGPAAITPKEWQAVREQMAQRGWTKEHQTAYFQAHGIPGWSAMTRDQRNVMLGAIRQGPPPPLPPEGSPDVDPF